jgi:hypothetical protein
LRSRLPRSLGPSARIALGVGALLSVSAAAAPQVDAEPSRLLLGTGTRVRIAVRAGGGELRAVASAGTLEALGTSDGAAHFLWTPPDTRAPFVALLAFWEAGALGLRTVTTLPLPCSGRTELAIDTEPSARVTVEIGGAHFGPRRADARGKLRMPVEVAPSAREARITAEVGEQSKVRIVPLPTVPSPFAWAVEPSPLRAGSAGRAMLLAPEPLDQRLAVRTSSGQLEREAAEPDRVLYRLVPLPGVNSVSLEASLGGEAAPRATTVVAVEQPVEAPAQVPPPPEPAGRRLELGAAVGAFFGGGHNAGPALAATLSAAPWPIALYLELELGLRAAWFSTAVPGLGTASSSLLVFPFDLAVRGEVWRQGRWSVDLRAGGGLLLGTNWLSSDFGQGSSQALTGWEVFGGAQLLYRVGAFLPYLELRGAYATATGTGVAANPGGFLVLVGFHWVATSVP